MNKLDVSDWQLRLSDIASQMKSSRPPHHLRQTLKALIDDVETASDLAIDLHAAMGGDDV